MRETVNSPPHLVQTILSVLRSALGLSILASIGCWHSESTAPPAVSAAAASQPPAAPLQGEPTETPIQERDLGFVRLAAFAPDAPKPREPLFKDWPKPKFALVVTGQQYGYLEPCGCTGLANQKGGLARRHSLLRELTGQGWEVVPLDVGNQVRRFGRQAEIQFQTTAEALHKMNYRAVGLGPDDLRLSAGELVAATAGTNRFVSSNVTVLDPDLLPRYQVITAGGKRIGVTAVLGSEHFKKLAGDDVSVQAPVEALSAVWPRLKKESCDLYVLLAYAALDESRALATKFPEFDIVVTAGGAGEPTLEPEKIVGSKGVMVQVGTKGMYAGVLGVFDDGGRKLRYQRVPLDDRYADSKDMLALLASYQGQLETAGLNNLGVKPLPHPSGSKFVGSEACGACHTKAFEVWKETTHATATESLVHPKERSEISRHFDPECLSCHVTGWNPQKYYPYTGGYLALNKPALHGNGCENCHGPGSAHVAAEKGDKTFPAAIKALRATMRLPLAEAEKRCMECHDLDNSPDFHVKGAFDKYWKEVEHKGLK